MIIRKIARSMVALVASCAAVVLLGGCGAHHTRIVFDDGPVESSALPMVDPLVAERLTSSDGYAHVSIRFQSNGTTVGDRVKQIGRTRSELLGTLDSSEFFSTSQPYAAPRLVGFINESGLRKLRAHQHVVEIQLSPTQDTMDLRAASTLPAGDGGDQDQLPNK